MAHDMELVEQNRRLRRMRIRRQTKRLPLSITARRMRELFLLPSEA
jgi:hypothetical protein